MRVVGLVIGLSCNQREVVVTEAERPQPLRIDQAKIPFRQHEASEADDLIGRVDYETFWILFGTYFVWSFVNVLTPHLIW